MFLKYVKKYWYLCLLTSIMVIAETVVDLWQPSMMADIVDKGVLQQNFSIIWSLGIRMIIIVILGGITGIFGSIFGNMASQNVGFDLRTALFARTMHLSPAQAASFTTGSLINRLSDDVTRLQDSVKVAFRGIARYAFMLLGGIFMLYRQAPLFALVALCALPFLIFFCIFFLSRSTKMFGAVQKKLDGVTSTMQEDITGARVIKAYSREEAESGKFEKANSALFGSSLKVQRFLAFLSPCMNIVLNLCVCAVILIGGINIQTEGTITPGQVMAGITYFAIILTGASVLGNLSQTFIRARASWSRIKEVLETEPDITDGSISDTKDVSDIFAPVLEFRNVSFTYPDGTAPALSGISFAVNAGQTLAIIGPTGSGKSTLANLIPRFYDAGGGEILLNGINIKEYRLNELRSHISYVLQRSELFSRSIKENISWGRENASMEEIRHAALIAQAADFIEESPDGYDSEVSEAGHSLSGGQKQRIAIARAILTGADILIMDDCTNALDLKTEASLYKALEEEYPDMTKVIVSTRIASVRSADLIAVMDGGRITAIGSHEELLRTSALYKEIYDSQLKGGAGND